MNRFGLIKQDKLVDYKKFLKILQNRRVQIFDNLKADKEAEFLSKNNENSFRYEESRLIEFFHDHFVSLFKHFR